MTRLHLGGDGLGRAAAARPGKLTTNGLGRMAEAVADRYGAVFRMLGMDGHGDVRFLEDNGNGAVEVDDGTLRCAAEARRGRYTPFQPFAREEGFEGDGIHAGARCAAAWAAVGARIRNPAALRRAAVAHAGLTSSLRFRAPGSRTMSLFKQISLQRQIQPDQVGNASTRSDTAATTQSMTRLRRPIRPGSAVAQSEPGSQAAAGFPRYVR